jgi:hypothetical protein
MSPSSTRETLNVSSRGTPSLFPDVGAVEPHVHVVRPLRLLGPHHAGSRGRLRCRSGSRATRRARRSTRRLSPRAGLPAIAAAATREGYGCRRRPHKAEHLAPAEIAYPRGFLCVVSLHRVTSYFPGGLSILLFALDTRGIYKHFHAFTYPPFGGGPFSMLPSGGGPDGLSRSNSHGPTAAHEAA